MKRNLVSKKLAIAAAAVAFFGAAGGAITQLPIRLAENESAPAFVADEVLVKFQAPVGGELQSQTIEAYGGSHLGELTSNGYVRVKLREGMNVPDVIARFKADSNIESVQPNYIYRFHLVPNDSSYGQMWGLKNIGQAIVGPSYPTNNPGSAGQDMDLEAAWDRLTDCSSIVVAVIDSGVNYRHEDLAANMWDGSSAGFPNHGFNFVEQNNDPMPQDVVGHGTHVAGTIGAVGNNNMGTTGVCWRASIMAIRVGGNISTTAAIIQGMNFAVARGAKVINMSLGSPNFDAAFDAAVISAKEAGVVVVVAAGNDGTNNDGGATQYPCNFTHDNLICVAALDQSYALAQFSNYGATSVDVAAPGVNVLSPWPGITITDNFSVGWTGTAGFAQGICDPDGGGPLAPRPMLVSPPAWCVGGSYLNNRNDVAYKSFNLTGFTHARLNYSAYIDTELNFDFIGTAYRTSGGDPFLAGGVLVSEVSGSSGGFPVARSTDLNNCRVASCTIGFRLRSDATNTSFGLGMYNFRIDTVQTNSSVYRLLDGTSMASPHVAGLAAMIWAHSPSYTYLDVVNAIRNGGELIPALAGKTTTGRAVNAMGSLRFINQPVGVTAVVQ